MVGKFWNKTVLYVSGATFLGVAVSLFVFFPHQTLALESDAYFLDETPTPQLIQWQSINYGTLLNEAHGLYFEGDYGSVSNFYISLCRDGSSSVTLSAHHYRGLTHLATSSNFVMISNLPLCSSISSTTPQLSELTQFSFVDSLNIKNGDSILVYTEPVSDNISTILFSYGTTTSYGYDVTIGAVGQGTNYTLSSITYGYLPYYYIDTAPDLVTLSASDYVNTKFTDLTISSTTGYVNFEVDYYLDPEEYDSSISAKNATTFAVSLSLRPSTDFTTYGYSLNGSTGNQTADGDWTSVLADGTYDYLIKFSNFGCSSGLSACPFPLSYITGNFTLSGGIITSSSTPNYFTAERFASWIEIGESPYYECSVTDIAGCLKNVVVWAFVPGDFSTEYWQSTLDYAETKTPFIYAFQFQTEIETLANAATGSLPTLAVDFPGVGTTTLMDSSWFDNGSVLDIGGALLYTLSSGVFYLLLAVLLWKRTKRFTYSLTNGNN